jgi:peptidoglycan/xylan/chitin deacetylase (PgdA/CDA1 family)
MTPTILKHILEFALLRGGPAALGRRATQGRALVLAYHNVVPNGARAVGELALHIHQKTFATQLDYLLRIADLVPLADLFTTRQRANRPRVVITFDDAYAGALTVGAHELVRRGLPATIFVAPGLLGGRSFWWDDVAGQDSGTLPTKRRETLIEECAGRDENVRARVGLPADTTQMPSYARSATIAQLTEAVQAGAITLGAHAWDHPNLAALNATELDAELRRSLEWLRQTFPERALSWLTYPYGRHSDRVHKAALAAGYDGAFRIEGGWLPADAQPGFALPRLNVPAGLSAGGFALRLAGLLCK